MGRHTMIISATDARQARLNHDKRVAASRAKLEAANAKMVKAQARGTNKALQRAAARFLPAGSQLDAPRALDLGRWPYASEPMVRDVPQPLRDAILEEDTLCVWCRESASTTIDHVCPLNRGGSNHPLNLVGACGLCNYIKADFLPAELGWVIRLPLRAFYLGQAS